jgi:hypothetical protein
VTLFDSRVAKLRWLRLCKTNLGVAAERTKRAVYSFGTSEAGVKNRYTVDSSVADAQVAQLRIDSSEGKGFEGRFCTQLSRLAG